MTPQRTARVTPQRLTRLQRRAVHLAAKRGQNIAAIAVANMLARIVWAEWQREVDFQVVAAHTTAA